MIKILANDGISEEGKKLLEKNDFFVSTERIEQAALIDEINKNKYDVLLVRSATKVNKELIEACPSLKLIGRAGVGLDNIDVEYAEKKGIKVINTPGASSRSVAELVMGHLFSLSRFMHLSNREMPVEGANNFKNLKKKYSKGMELKGKTLGIIGFGRIGQELAKYAISIGMNVIAYDIKKIDPILVLNIAKQEIRININVDTNIKNLLKQSDFITLHMPMPPDRKAIIGKKEIEQMKDGAYIINTSRGGLIDETALLEALDNGKLAGAALDVFYDEPNPNKLLLKNEKISVTPHIGGSTIEAQSRIGIELAEKIIRFFG